MADIYLNTNIVLNETYDRYGNLMSDYNPIFPYKSEFRLFWQLYTDTPNADGDGKDMTSWTKANFAGCSALLTCDNDFVHRLNVTLNDGISSGDIISTISLNIGTNQDLIPASGFVTIFNDRGGFANFLYESVTFSGTVATLQIGTWEADANYMAGGTAKISQEPYFQCYSNANLSNPTTGLFVFDVVVYSRKLAVQGDANNDQWIDCQGVELLPFKIEDEKYLELPSYLCRTARMSVNMGEAGTNPVVTPSVSNMIASFVYTLVSGGLEVQGSTDGNIWVDYDEIEDFQDLRWFRFRLAGSGADWSAAVPLIIGPTGEAGAAAGFGTPTISASSLPSGSSPTASVSASGEDTAKIFSFSLGIPKGDKGDAGPAISIQYSENGAQWHSTLASGDKFIRFSTDDGTTWTTAVQFVGDDAPEITIQYSATGGSGTWHETLAATDYYIRFSVDDGSTWSGASQFKAYPVRSQYGQTASATFHDNFVAGSDKFIKFSSDNGATWSNAMQFVGDDGQSFVPNATGTYADRDNYDAEEQGFAYLVTSGENEGKIYFKVADTSGSWSNGLQFTPNGVSLQYSVNGTSWHTTATSEDIYIRFSTDNGTTWSNALLFKGVSTYTYTAYASDSSGNDFSLTRSSDLDYWNWIYSESPIAQENLTLQTFNTLGTGWTLFQGDDGITYDWLSGTAAPSNSSGKDGDWYLQTSTGDIYLKNSGAWVNKMNIVGPAGAGAKPRGAWIATTSYVENDMVSYDGSMYIAGRNNSGVTPGTSSADWTLYVSKGDVGPSPTIDPTTKHWMIDGTDSGVTAEATFTNSYVDVTSVNANNETSFTGINIIPVGIKAPSGKYYAIEKESVSINTSTSTSTLKFDAYLAYENAASFSGSWRVYFSGGQKGDKGDAGIIQFNMVVSSSEPANPYDGLIWVNP